LGRIYGKEINERAKKSPSFSCKKYGKRRGQKILELPQHSVWVSSLTATPAITSSFRAFLVKMWRFCKALRPMPGFTVDEAPNDASYTAELFATVRSNGRILDEFRCVLGGTDCLEAEFSLSKLFEDPTVAEHSIQIQRWPRDLDLRKGLLSGLWKDISALVSSRDACVSDKEGAGISASEFLRTLDQSKAHAAARWAVVLADNEKLALQLQGLPAAAAVLNGKPSFKR